MSDKDKQNIADDKIKQQTLKSVYTNGQCIYDFVKTVLFLR